MGIYKLDGKVVEIEDVALQYLDEDVKKRLRDFVPETVIEPKEYTEKNVSKK